MKIWKWIKSLFAGQSYQDTLEYYIASKHPTTTVEVEYWIRVFQHDKEWAL